MKESHSIIAGQVGARLRELRGDFTQKEFAKRLGLRQTQYSRYESGKRLAPDGVLLRLAEISGTPPEEIIFGPASPTSGGDEPPPDYSLAVGRLATLLDDQGREDLYYFLKAKTKSLNLKQESGLQEAALALEGLRRKTG